MYLGRFIVVAPDRAAYRVSSRSFPDRRVVDRDGTLTVAPTPDAPATDNPYVSYNCLRVTDDGDAAVVGNGSHVDPILEKLEAGYPARDALAVSLLALDYEKDDYDTPRIAGVLGPDGSGTVGIVRRDALLVRTVEEPTLVATYEEDDPTATSLPRADPDELARAVYDLEYDHPVCAAAVVRTGDGFAVATYNGP